VKGLDGSTARTATSELAARIDSISRSVRVDLPAPGAPVKPVV
jgi:hypothetical protein